MAESTLSRLLSRSVGFVCDVRIHAHIVNLSFLFSTNIGNAKIDGLAKDLGMTADQYNATLTIFFVSYSVFEPLTNVLLKRLRPSIFIPSIMLAWV